MDYIPQCVSIYHDKTDMVMIFQRKMKIFGDSKNKQIGWSSSGHKEKAKNSLAS